MKAESTPARLLRDARWMTGLTQAEVAQRAGLTRQVISSYESGTRCPSVGTLERMLAGCGLRLRLSVVPEPGLEDAPTFELLKVAPLDRLDTSADLRDAFACSEQYGSPRRGWAAAKRNGRRAWGPPQGERVAGGTTHLPRSLPSEA